MTLPRELWLLRHAKSSWAEGGMEDHARPLAPRGKKAAPLIGRTMRELGLVPQQVLCSTAVRAKETWRRVHEALGDEATVEFADGLYHADAASLLARIQAADDAVTRLMLVGHNPGLHDLALQLAGEGDEKDIAKLAGNLPTAGLVRLGFAQGGWQAVGPGQGRLLALLLPRELG